ncbi:MAG: hypothetical protein ACHQU0_03805 [Candidatus Paceibacteria bacterium]
MVSVTAYHGTNQVFDKFDQGKSRILNDFYGGGVAYFTENRIVSEQYARAMVKKSGGTPHIYTVRLSLKKIFDVDKTYTSKELLALVGSDVDGFARGAGMMNLGVDKYAVLSDLKSGSTAVKGSDVFKGMSRGMVKTADARERLKKTGYDALRYNGGLNMSAAIKHSVWIVYHATSITITNVENKK